MTQQAFAACVKDEKPCLDALFAAVSGLDRPTQHNQWQRIKELMRDKTTTAIGLGYFDGQRVAADYDLVKTYIGMDLPFDVKAAYSNEFLDQSIKMAQ